MNDLIPGLRLAFVLLGLAVIAGCTSTSTTDAMSSVAGLDEDHGVVSGTVLDEALAPISDVRMTLGNGEIQFGLEPAVTTSEDGTFAFSGVPVGSYVVSASKPNYENASTEVVVFAGETTYIRVTLTGISGPAPYRLLFVKTGIVGCTVSFVYNALNCDQALNTSRNRIIPYDIPAGHQVVIVENDWADRAASMTVQYFGRLPGEDSGGLVATRIGPPVLRLALEPGASVCCPPLTTPWRAVPTTDQEYVLVTGNHYGGHYRSEINGTIGPACGMVSSYCGGVGLVLEFRFDQYVSVFVNYRPTDVASYTALPDA